MESKDGMKFITTRAYERAEIFLKELGFSNTLMRKSFREGRIKRGERSIYRSTPLAKGDEVTADFFEEETRIKKEPLAQKIIYEDGDLLVLDKGIIPSMPCRMYPEHTLANEIAGHFDRIGLKRKVRMLGRLDKETTGVLIACKNPLAYQRLLEGHTRAKRYLAVVKGKVLEGGTLNLPIGPGDDSLVRVVREDGQSAITHYRPLKEAAGNTLVELRLETGRCHQIRCHMASIGHPVVGDELYGGGEGAMKLHVHKIQITHPRTGREMVLEAAPARGFFPK